MNDAKDSGKVFDRRSWWLNAAAWTLLATTNASATAADLLRAGQPSQGLRLFAYFLAVYTPWFLITPAVFWWIERFPPGQASWRRLLWRYLPLLPLWIVFYLPTQAAIATVARHGSLSRFVETLAGMPFNQWVIDAVYLVALIGVAGAIHQLRATRRRERQAAHLAIENAGLETRLSKARLEMLRAQLEPHFLYNALNSIAALVNHGDSEKAVEAVGLLSELLRYATRATDSEWVLLAEEVDFAEAYWTFQQVRYGPRLQCDYDVDPNSAASRLPPLILQPLLENAIRHGVEALEAPSRVRLEIRRRGESSERQQIEVVIRNSPGILGSPSTGLGVGLRNTRERLQWIYGDDAELHLEAAGGGITARLLVPAEMGP